MKELLERERELAAVEELLGRRSGVLAIEAGVGIGKTWFIDAACQTSARTWLRRFYAPAGLNLKQTSHWASCGNCSSGHSQVPERMSAHHYSSGPPLQ